MNKLASVLISIILLVLINGLAIAGNISITGFDKQTNGYQFVEGVYLGKQMLPTASITFTAYNIAGMTGFDFYVNDVASGNITTMNIQWIDQDGNLYNSETLTSGTPITKFQAASFIGTIYNPVTITNNITANVIIGD